jgi:hypothetical protein
MPCCNRVDTVDTELERVPTSDGFHPIETFVKALYDWRR